MRVSKNFNKSEFDSKDGSAMPADVLLNIQCLAINLQVIRGRLNKAIIINSGYRSPSHNARVGGAKNSQHVKGRAADIKVNGMTSLQLYQFIEALILEGIIMEGGLGIYKTFVHYDTRGVHARWDSR